MDFSFLFQILFLIILLPFIIFLIHLVLKFGGKYMNNMANGRLIRVMERVQLGQNTFMSVVIIDNKPYVITNGDKGAEILMELDEDVIERYKNNNVLNYKAAINLDKLLNYKFKGKVKNEKIQ
jgi:flagellar protein FliO/FliZ